MPRVLVREAERFERYAVKIMTTHAHAKVQNNLPTHPRRQECLWADTVGEQSDWASATADARTRGVRSRPSPSEDANAHLGLLSRWKHDGFATLPIWTTMIGNVHRFTRHCWGTDTEPIRINAGDKFGILWCACVGKPLV